MCQTFIPLLAPSGRIVNLSSVASSLKACSEMIQQRFRNPDITISDIRQLEQEFLVTPFPLPPMPSPVLLH